MQVREANFQETNVNIVVNFWLVLIWCKNSNLKLAINLGSSIDNALSEFFTSKRASLPLTVYKNQPSLISLLL